MTTSVGMRERFSLTSRKKREEYRNASHFGRNSILALFRESEAATNSNNFTTVYRITTKTQLFDCPMTDINDRFLIHNAEGAEEADPDSESEVRFFLPSKYPSEIKSLHAGEISSHLSRSLAICDLLHAGFTGERGEIQQTDR